MTAEMTHLHCKLAVGVNLLRRTLAQVLHIRQAAQELVLCLLRLCSTAEKAWRNTKQLMWHTLCSGSFCISLTATQVELQMP